MPVTEHVITPSTMTRKFTEVILLFKRIISLKFSGYCFYIKKKKKTIIIMKKRSSCVSAVIWLCRLEIRQSLLIALLICSPDLNICHFWLLGFPKYRACGGSIRTTLQMRAGTMLHVEVI